MAGSDGAIRVARDLAGRAGERFWYADQYANPANPAAHVRTTGPEIWRATEGRVTHLVAGIGTSGTLMGTGEFLRHKNPEVKLLAVQPEGPLHGLEGLKHLASALVPPIYNPAVPDETVFVDTERADLMVGQVARARGLFVGWSTGAALVAAENVLRRLPRGEGPTVVVIAPDSGQRYLSDASRRLGFQETHTA
jgi:cysteine synthase B